MPERKITLITILVLLLMIPADGQQKTRVVNGRVEASHEEMELERQKYEKLKNPDFLTLEVSEISDEPKHKSEGLPIIYKAGKAIKFQLVITNTSAEPAELRVSDTFNQNRPQLLKDGQVVPYQSRVLRLVRARDKEAVLFSERPALLGVNQAFRQIIDLEEWYGSLEPGWYELSVRHLFVRGGEWIASTSVNFEVQPR